MNHEDHPEPRAGRFRRRRDRRLDGAGGDHLMLSLQAELALLREENARLQAEQYRQPDTGAVLSLVRALPQRDAVADDVDEAAAMLVEGIVLRDSLLAVCEELGSALLTMQLRLRALGAETLGDHAADAA